MIYQATVPIFDRNMTSVSNELKRNYVRLLTALDLHDELISLVVDDQG